MHQLIEHLEAFDPQPTLIQLSVDGDWENAARIPLPAGSGSMVAPGKIDESVAVEFMYTLNDDRQIFTGYRFASGLERAATPTIFVRRLLGLAKAISSSSLAEGIELAGKALTGDGATFMAGPPMFTELGVMDNWKTMNPRLLTYQDNNPLINRGKLQDILDDAPQLAGNTVNHMAVELAWMNPEHWLGVQVSRDHDGYYEIDPLDVINVVNDGVIQ